jgi:hypothetical protein
LNKRLKFPTSAYIVGANRKEHRLWGRDRLPIMPRAINYMKKTGRYDLCA